LSSISTIIKVLESREIVCKISEISWSLGWDWFFLYYLYSSLMLLSRLGYIQINCFRILLNRFSKVCLYCCPILQYRYTILEFFWLIWRYSTTIEVIIVFSIPGMPRQNNICLLVSSQVLYLAESRSYWPVPGYCFLI
jgi:hypothetical protein